MSVLLRRWGLGCPRLDSRLQDLLLKLDFLVGRNIAALARFLEFFELPADAGGVVQFLFHLPLNDFRNLHDAADRSQR
ncbi:hypothetical protein A5737_08300 [Mycobacterium colombiense]|nr:hypothetical protein A5737_08300 [Mycobacterium colombiense]